MRLFFKIFFFLLFCTQLLAIGRDTSLHWKYIETPHLKVVFEKKNEKLAKKYALYGEIAYNKLFKVFKEGPEKVSVIINDNTDITNGYATFLPYPYIMIYPVLPNPTDSISHYDKWELEMITHELTHIFSFYPANGIYTPFKYIFGNVTRPNALLPLWWHEGLAVNMESRLTKKGRLNSPLYESYIRLLSRPNFNNISPIDKESLDRINESGIPSWPYGQRPYFFGALIWHDMIQKDPSLVQKLTHEYSKRIPYLINAPLKEKIGQDYVGLLNSIYNKYKKFHEHKSHISNVEFSETLNHGGHLHRSPSISPDKKSMIYISNTTGKTEIRLSPFLDQEKNPYPKYSVLIKGGGLQKVSWSKDSKSLIYDKLARYNKRYMFSDLYQYHLNSKKETQLTFGERAVQAEYSPQMKKVVYVKKGAGNTQLKIINLKNQKIHTLYSPPLHTRISYPTFISENEILFLFRNRKGDEYLKSYHLKKKKTSIYLKNEKALNFLKKVSDHSFLVASNKSNLNNLYYIKKLKSNQLIPLTNSPSHVLSGEYNPNTQLLIFSDLTTNGHKLKYLKKQKFIDPTFYNRSIPSTQNNEFPHFKITKSEIKNTKSKISKTTSDYSSLPYMLPQYWIPFIYPLENGTLIQGSTTVQDPLGFHQYALDASFDTSTEKTNFSFAYSNHVTPIGLHLQYLLLNELISSSNEVIANHSGSFGFSSYIPGLNHRWTWGGNWYELNSQEGSLEYKRSGPGLYFTHSHLDESNILGGGYKFHFSHSEYLKKDNYVNYGRSYLSYYQNFSDHLASKQNLSLNLKAAWAPHIQLNSSALKALGDKTINGNYFASNLSSTFLMRGYPSGIFLSREAINFNLEYSFPLWDIFSGGEYIPFFLKKITGNFFIDGIALDGAYSDKEINGLKAVEMDKQFFSTGVEAHLSTTVGNHLPMSFIFGLYYGFDEKAHGGEVTPFLGLGLSGIEGLVGKKIH